MKEEKPNISLCMIVKDEEANLAECLSSASGVVREIVIIDTGSTDRTVEIAKSFGAEICAHKWPGSFAQARNLALDRARGDWVLVLDADERLDSASLTAMADAVQSSEADGYSLVFRNYVTDEPSPDMVCHRVCRLFRNKVEHRFTGRIHEIVEPSITNSGGIVAELDAVVHHYGYRKSVMEERGKHERNVALLKAELKDNPRNAYHLFNLGMSYFTNGDHEEAVKYFRKAANLVPFDNQSAPRINSCLAKALSASGKNNEALQVIERAQAAGLAHPELSYLKGNALLAKQRFPEAEAAFDQAVKLGEKDERWSGDAGSWGYKAYYGIARARMGCRDYAGAAEAAEETLLQKPGLALAHKLLGEAYLTLDELPKAESNYSHYVGSKGKSPDGHVGLGRVYAAQGRFQDAMDSFSAAIENDPRCGDAYMCAGDLLYQLGHYNDAADIYQNGLTCSPDQAAGFTALANCYFQLGAYDSAALGYQQALALQPEYEPALRNLGKVQAALAGMAA